MQSLRKKKYIIRLFAIINVLCLLLTFVGCGSGDVNNNSYRSIKGGVAPSGVLAQNSKYELLWDSDAKAVLMKSIETGNVWSDIIYEAYQEDQMGTNVTSPIYMTVVNTQTLKWTTFKSSVEIPDKGNIVSKKIENGIRVTYFFDTYKLAIPVEYILREDSVAVSVNTEQILENADEYKLISIGIGQNFCSVKNEAENGQLFVPVGNGAVINTAVTPNGEKNYVAEVYGTDAARQVIEDFKEETNIKMPVFGASSTGKGMLAIIEEGAASAQLEAEAGNERLGYSKVGAAFYLRGYDTFMFSRSGKKESATTRISDKLARNKIAVAFYPLEGESTDYTAMAKRYKQYLADREMLNKSKSSESPYAVTFLGGTHIVKSFLGVPYNQVAALTTFSEAKEILTELENETGVIPETRLLGFSDTGIRAGKVAGGKTYPSEYGNKKDIESLVKFFEKKDANIFFDSEIVKFNKSGDGYSTQSDAAKTAIKKIITHTTVDPMRNFKKAEKYSIVSRSKLGDAVDTVIQKAEKYGYNTISLSSLSSIAYSDFDNPSKYSAKYNMDKEVYSLLNSIKKDNYIVAAASANEYAALASDLIFEAPITNGNYNAFDASVPFYQMVFHSYKPMYSEALNLYANRQSAFAKAVAYGTGLGFTIISDYVAESDDLDVYKLYGMVYEDNQDLIKKMVVDSGYDKLYKEIKDAELVSYSMTGSVSKTEYSNGKVVYVNHSDKAAVCEAGEIGAFAFIAG